jgi:hypothetical protein
MKTGEKIRLKSPIRSAKVGVGFLPLEGILVRKTESLGREVWLVNFGNGVSEYIYPEVEGWKEAA